jgi:universal stress protein E
MKNIIVIADTQGGKNSALKRALQIQQRTGAHISLLGFCYAPPDNDSGTAKSAEKIKTLLTAKHNKDLAALLKRYDATANISTQIIWSKDIAGQLLSLGKLNNAGLIIKSAHRSGTWLHTSTDWQLIRESKIPVMITAGKSWKKKPRLLASIDFATTLKSKQKLNDKIIAHAKLLLGPLGDNSIHLAFALTAPQALLDIDLISTKKYLADKRKRLNPVIAEFCDRHGLNRENVHMKPGEPERVIPSIAKSLKADLTIVGTVGRKGLKGKLVGNTAEGILSHFYSDILTIRP